MEFPRQEYWSGFHHFCMAFSWPRDQTCVSCIGRRTLHHWATTEATLGSEPSSIINSGLLGFTMGLSSLRRTQNNGNKRVIPAMFRHPPVVTTADTHPLAQTDTPKHTFRSAPYYRYPDCILVIFKTINNITNHYYTAVIKLLFSVNYLTEK